MGPAACPGTVSGAAALASAPTQGPFLSGAPIRRHCPRARYPGPSTPPEDRPPLAGLKGADRRGPTSGTAGGRRALVWPGGELCGRCLAPGLHAQSLTLWISSASAPSQGKPGILFIPPAADGRALGASPWGGLCPARLAWQGGARVGSAESVGSGSLPAPGIGASTRSLSFYFNFCGLALLNARLQMSIIPDLY